MRKLIATLAVVFTLASVAAAAGAVATTRAPFATRTVVTVVATRASINGYDMGWGTADCPVGSRPVGGGINIAFGSADPNGYVTSSHPTETGWHASANLAGADSARIYAVCLSR